MFLKLKRAVFSGINSGLLFAIITGTLAFMGAPVLFGVTLISSAIALTVLVYTGIGFLLGFLWRLFTNDG